MSLLAPALDTLLFRDLPKVIILSREEVKWHFNPLCNGCRYEQDCKSRAVEDGELGSMPNISIDDARVVKDLLRLGRVAAPTRLDGRLTDIEELHTLVATPHKLELIAKASPSVIKKAERILALQKKRRNQTIAIQSPIVEAARTKNIQVVPRRNYTCPTQEDVAVVISIINDPSSSTSGGDYFHVTTYCRKPVANLPVTIACGGADFISQLAQLIRSLETLQNSKSFCRYTTQFYVWSSGEQALLQGHIISAALTTSDNESDIRLCIGALAQGASLLQTTFQPLLLSGALIGFLSKGRRLKAELKACLDRMDLSTEGTVDALRKRIDNEIRKLQEEAGATNLNSDERRKEFGQLPRVVVLKKEVERQLALPIPGYWDLPDDEEVFAAYKKEGGDDASKELLQRRNRFIYRILTKFRTVAVSSTGHSLLVNRAKVLSTRFMDFCKEPHIRKLFFMQQFEVLAKLTELWQSRIDSCPEAPTLEYIGPSQDPSGMEHMFRVVSGTVDVPASDRDHSFFDKLLVLDAADSPNDESGDSLPAEALFDDLCVSGLVFPLNRCTKASWSQQDARVQQELCLADVRNVFTDTAGRGIKVAMRTWSTSETPLQRGAVYRLSPRHVDFNTTKILSALFELDLCWESQSDLYDGDEDDAPHHFVPFLQLILDPNSLGKIPAAKQYVKTENEMQKLFRDLKGLGNDVAGSLVLKASQHHATQRILSNRLSVIWGPPGTGKTYTISLSLLRLIEVERRRWGPRSKIVFITAITHAAIEACRSKLVRLMDAYRSIDSLPNKWLEDVTIEVVSRGNDHPAPRKAGTLVQIYAGTIYQLSNFTKKHTMEVDCVIIDEAGQISLGSISLVLRCLSDEGRIIIAGDSEQLAPILSAQYPLLKFHSLFGSVLDCLMFSRPSEKARPPSPSPGADGEPASSQGTIVQLTENFRLNPDLGEFVSTIYSRQFKPQKVQARQLAIALRTVADFNGAQLGIRSTIFNPVQKFLTALSDVMFNQPQSVLVAPEVHSTTPTNLLIGTSDVALTHRPVSLALVRLRTWSARTPNIAYEVHVRGEAAVAAALVISLRKCSPNDDIFVATPHRIQREAVKSALARLKVFDDTLEDVFERLEIGADKPKARPRVTVDTIERLQGSEAAFVICLFSLPKALTSDLGFLLERRRLNVAISRAKTLCILISSDEVLYPSVKVLADEETAKGYAFLKAYQKRAWSYQLPVKIDNFT
ncbi:hypothetical protein NLJ89_g10100 [Agrocybe chaxingu]|uniref:DNA2/NAM7 helicase-like C-terminal domain-containing protein n=1 Tax=Agrocybe chaxingu TaxID=84603 RepID=A0A9W8JPH2_9AGAR|nr:hypothetical protein NLJ89_g10100 [Agrocybe chaxingu]